MLKKKTGKKYQRKAQRKTVKPKKKVGRKSARKLRKKTSKRVKRSKKKTLADILLGFGGGGSEFSTTEGPPAYFTAGEEFANF